MIKDIAKGILQDAYETYKERKFPASEIIPNQFYVTVSDSSETGYDYNVEFTVNGVRKVYSGHLYKEFFDKLGYEKVVKGHWIDGAFENSKKCSVCGRYATKIHSHNEPVFDYKSCPYCRAIMEDSNYAEED